MSARISNISFDAHDPYAQMVWWDGVLEDYSIHPEAGDAPGDDECGLDATDGTSVLFLRVPEGKVVKNRVHLCLSAVDGDRDMETDRLLRHGATLVADRRTADGKGWAVLADPEGNEFCVVRAGAADQE